MIPGGSQTPINTGQNRTSNRFQTGRNENRQERRRNQANLNEFLEAILWNEGRVLPVSSLLTDYRGISNVCVSVPSIVGHRGVEGLLPVPMNVTEEVGLQSSAEAIQHVVRSRS